MPNPLPSDAAYQIVMDEAMLDGNARLNLATFVTTWMDDNADKIMAHLWNAPSPTTTIGVSTVGSSEACMLGGLALALIEDIRKEVAFLDSLDGPIPHPGTKAGFSH